MPLGWLVERHQGSGFHQATLYVCCINLSTDPVSLWLIYDYRFPYGMWKSPVLVTRGEEGPDPQTSYKDPNCNHCCEDSSCPATGYEADKCMKKSSSLDQTTPGYLEQPRKWDIALYLSRRHQRLAITARKSPKKSANGGISSCWSRATCLEIRRTPAAARKPFRQVRVKRYHDGKQITVARMESESR